MSTSPSSRSAPAIRPAATIILTRSVPGDGGVEVYLGKRHRRAGFMAAHHVFPGGCVEPGDLDLAARLLKRGHRAFVLPGIDDAVEAAAYGVAAIRETAEECGLVLARDAAGQTPTREVARSIFLALHAGAAFAEQLRDHELLPDLPALCPFAWWITPPFEKRRYDTRFFIATAPADQVASVDDRELTEGVWMMPEEAIGAFSKRAIALAPPTLASLEVLVDGYQAALPPTLPPGAGQPIQPHLCEAVDGVRVLALPGDPLFPSPAPPALPHRTRFVLHEDGRFT